MANTTTHDGRDAAPPAGGAPPRTPCDEPPGLVDEGPMRWELRRQIEELEHELSELVVSACPWEPRRTSPRRGPALQDGVGLEAIRDELLDAVAELRARLAGGEPRPR